MRFLRNNFFSFLLLTTRLLWGVRGEPTCRPYLDDGVCSNYITGDDYIYLNGTVSLEEIENSLGNLKVAQGLSLIAGNSSSCIDAFTSFACSVAYPKCFKEESSPDSIPQAVKISLPCQSTCTNVNQQCSQSTDPLVLGYIKPLFLYPMDCSNISSTPPLNVQFPTSYCNSGQKFKSSPRCFPPLVEDTLFTSNNSLTLDSDYCRFGCCLPCPQPYYLYPS
ncbi:2379_t:CDS:2, partial [Acaulospora morrowiae]